MQLAVAFHNQLAPAVVGQAYADARIFHRAGDAYGLSCRDSRVVVGLHGLQRLGKARLRPDNLSVGQHLTGADGVAPADLPRADAHLVGHFIEQRFDGKARLRHAEATERAGRRVIGIIGSSLDGEIFIGIRPGGVRARAFKNRSAQRGKRARIGDDFRFHAEDMPLFVAAHRKVHPKRVTLGMDKQRLCARQLHLDRQTRHISDKRRVMLYRHVLLATEAAAHELVLHLDFLRAKKQRALMQRGVRRLVSGKQHHIAVFVQIAHGALGLQKSMLRPRRFKVARDDVFRLCDRAVGIAARHPAYRLHVRAFLIKDMRRVIGSSFSWVMYRRQNLIFHIHQLFRLFQRQLIFCHDERDRITQIMCQPANGNERILVVLDVADAVFSRNIVRSQHGQHPVQRQRTAGVDFEHPRTRVFCPYGRAVGHTGHIPVIGIFTVTLHLFGHIQPVHARAELPVGMAGCRNLTRSFQLCRQFDRSDDLHIARAAAVVVAKGVFDLLLGGIWIFIQQRLGAQHHARNTEAALHRARLAVGIGIQGLFFIRQPLDREDVLPLEFVCVGRAGPARLAVDQNRTRAARALRTAILDRRELQFIAQVAQQFPVGFHRHRHAIDIEFRHNQNSF